MSISGQLATLRATILTDVKGTANAQRQLTSFTSRSERELNKASRSMGGFKTTILGATGAVGGLGTAYAGIKLAEFADRYTQLQNQIKSATQYTNDYVKVSRDLNDVSIRVGSSLEANVKIFQFTSQVRKDLGATNDEMVRMIETLGKLGILSGASNLEMKFGLRQMAQGLAAGNLRAEELNSLLENIPETAKRIAHEMGMTPAALRLLVLEGEIRSKAVYDALTTMADGVDRDFKGIELTMSRGWASLTAASQAYIGEVNTGIDGTKTIAEGLTAAANALAQITPRKTDEEFHIERQIATVHRYYEAMRKTYDLQKEEGKLYQDMIRASTWLWQIKVKEIEMNRNAIEFFYETARLVFDKMRIGIDYVTTATLGDFQIGIDKVQITFLELGKIVAGVMRDIDIAVAETLSKIPGVDMEGGTQFQGMIDFFEKEIEYNEKSIELHQKRIEEAGKQYQVEMKHYDDRLEKIKELEAAERAWIEGIPKRMEQMAPYLEFRRLMEDPTHGLKTVDDILKEKDEGASYYKKFMNTDYGLAGVQDAQSMTVPQKWAEDYEKRLRDEFEAQSTKEVWHGIWDRGMDVLDELRQKFDMFNQKIKVDKETGVKQRYDLRHELQLQEMKNQKPDFEKTRREQERQDREIENRALEQKYGAGPQMDLGLASTNMDDLTMQSALAVAPVLDLGLQEESQAQSLESFEAFLSERLEMFRASGGNIDNVTREGADAQLALQAESQGQSMSNLGEFMSARLAMFRSESVQNIAMSKARADREAQIQATLSLFRLRSEQSMLDEVMRLNELSLEGLKKIGSDRIAMIGANAEMGVSAVVKSIKILGDEYQSFFELSKALHIANVIMTTAQAAFDAYAAGVKFGSWLGMPWLGIGLGAAAAGVVTAAGALQVKQIAGLQFKGGRQAGGHVSPGGLYEVNESGMEMLRKGGKSYLMTGDQSGEVVPNAGGGVSNINVMVHNIQGQQSSVMATEDNRGGIRLDVIIDHVESGIAQRVDRGGSSLSTILERRYGLNRASGSY